MVKWREWTNTWPNWHGVSRLLYISVQMHTSFNTEYRKLKDQRPGGLWFSLAEAATQAIAAQGQQTEAFLRSEIKGPPQ